MTFPLGANDKSRLSKDHRTRDVSSVVFCFLVVLHPPAKSFFRVFAEGLKARKYLLQNDLSDPNRVFGCFFSKKNKEGKEYKSFLLFYAKTRRNLAKSRLTGRFG